MGTQQTVNNQSNQSIGNNSLHKVGTQQDVYKTSMNVMKSYGSREGQQMSRTTTQVERKQKFKYSISIQNLKNTFKMFAIDGNYLNKETFNNSIENLFRFPSFPEMHFTYLSEKIYELLDDSGDGKIQEDEFIQGLKNVLSRQDFRIKLTMMAMMSLLDKTRNYIEPNEIKDYFFKSWVQGYKSLGFQLEKEKSDFQSRKLPLANSRQLEMWALKYEKEIKMAIESDLRDGGIDPNMNINYEQFKKWVYLDHTLYITYGHKTIMKATTLTKLDEIGFEDSPLQASNPNVPSSNNFNNNCNSNLPNNYPSF